VWSHSIIMCGHFPEGVETFEQPALDPAETKAQWYLRQMLGSANISGSKFMHLMSGNLSHQIEHHLFPDLPSNRYGEMSPKVRALFERYGLSYNARPLPQQVGSAWHRVLRLSLPNGWLDRSNRRNVVAQLRELARMVASGAPEAGAVAPAPVPAYAA
jgi:linoleoyl-CoA desaturase